MVYELTTYKHVVNYVIHVAACPPDTADRPLWNTNPSLDSLTWETLPAEFRKVAAAYLHEKQFLY